MLSFLYVSYREEHAQVGCVEAATWQGSAVWEGIIQVPSMPAYDPEALYRHELPCLLAAVQKSPFPDTIILPGYVWLEDGRPGVGVFLRRALLNRVAVIGVADAPLLGSSAPYVTRSGQPIWVSSVGMDIDDAVSRVEMMPGDVLPANLARAKFLSTQ